MDGKKTFSLNIHNFTNQSHYQQPEEIGHYSVDSNGEISHDKSQLRYFVNLDNVNFHLMEGFEERNFRSFDKKKFFHHVLWWILKHRDVFQIPQTSQTSTELGMDKEKQTSIKLSTLKRDFVVKRGCLSRILCSPYVDTESWKLSVIRFHDTFYLCDYTIWLDGEVEQKRLYTAQKFTQYLTSDKPNGRPNTKLPINDGESYNSVVQTKLGDHSLILSGEVDCVDSNGKPIKSKTKKYLFNEKAEDIFKRHQLLKYWAQSFILGVPRIICGFHKADIVHSLKEYITDEIPIIIKDIDNPWKPEICVNFLDQFLTFIKETIPINDHRKVYLFSREKNSSDITWDMVEADSKYHFLPDWYIEEFEH